MSTIDYTSSREFAGRINRITLGGKKLSDLFFYKEYNIWYFYQAAIFSDAKHFYAAGNIPEHKALSWKGHITSLLLLCFSMMSFCFVFIARKKVLFFSIDASASKYKGDFRMQGIYRLLHKHSIAFFECFHAVPSIKTVKTLFIRKRAVLYLESIDYLYYLTQIFHQSSQSEPIVSGADLSDFPEKEKAYARFVIQKYVHLVPHVLFRIRVWKIILRTLGIKLVMSIDDVRNYNELVVASNELGIPSFSFQHGHYSKYHRGFLRYDFAGKAVTPTKLFVWNQYWKQELERLHSLYFPDQIVVSGSPQSTSGVFATHGESDSEHISLLIPFETDAPKSEVIPYIQKLLAESTVQIVFKVRPDIDVSLQLHEYGLDAYNPRVTVAKNLQDTLGSISLVGGVYSTFLYDMVALKKPVFLFQTSMDYGEGLIHNGLAEMLSFDTITEGVTRVARTPDEVLQERFDTLEGTNPKDFDTTISDYLKTYEII